MNTITIAILGISAGMISSFFTCIAYKKQNSKIHKFVPLIVCFVGFLILGIGPIVFNYPNTVKLKLIFAFLSMLFTVGFFASFLTLVYLFILTRKN